MPQYYFVLQRLRAALPNLCAAQLAQSTSQYYFILHSLHKALPSTTILHSLHRVRPSTTSYYKACTCLHTALPNLCATQLAQSTSQYYFVLHSLHKVRPSTTLYYEACTKQLPVLLCNTKLTQNTFHLPTYHYRSLDAATPVRFTMSSCKKK